MHERLLSYAGLFSSLSTLFCCALPALFVTFGLGATLVSVLHAVPQLTWFSEHKAIVFVVAGAMLFANAVVRSSSQNQACPVDPDAAAACRSAKRFSDFVLAVSVTLYAVGAFFAFAAPLFGTDE